MNWVKPKIEDTEGVVELKQEDDDCYTWTIRKDAMWFTVFTAMNVAKYKMLGKDIILE